MKTATELTNEKAEEFDKARRYEIAKNEVYRLDRLVTALEAKAVNPQTIKDLEEMARVVEKLPAGLLTKGTLYVPGGFVARQVLETTIGSALADLHQRDAEVKKALVKTRTELAKAEALLATFTD